MNPDNLKSGDSDELEALFNEIADQKVWDDAPATENAQPAATEEATSVEGDAVAQEEKAGDDEPKDVFQKVGSLTRKLHDTLRELGYDKSVENAVHDLPDARARLSYIANLTGQAADKVLATVEVLQQANDDLAAKARQMEQNWERLFNHEMSLEEFKQHARASQGFAKEVISTSAVMGSNLTEIMMAQDFHDLTGQVVNRIATMAQSMEEQLVQLLIDTTPEEQRKQVEVAWLTGPAMNAEGRTDVCSDQSQVDDLLESLGF
ncbi:MAG: protein phosphatase CheZ [Limnobacter sp.]|nr:protein phosphatase CheZ [Limnobacter sp.]